MKKENNFTQHEKDLCLQLKELHRLLKEGQKISSYKELQILGFTTNKISTMKKEKILTTVGNARDHYYLWNTIEPTCHMAREILRSTKHSSKKEEKKIESSASIRAEIVSLIEKRARIREELEEHENTTKMNLEITLFGKDYKFEEYCPENKMKVSKLIVEIDKTMRKLKELASKANVFEDELHELKEYEQKKIILENYLIGLITYDVLHLRIHRINNLILTYDSKLVELVNNEYKRKEALKEAKASGLL